MKIEIPEGFRATSETTYVHNASGVTIRQGDGSRWPGETTWHVRTPKPTEPDGTALAHEGRMLNQIFKSKGLRIVIKDQLRWRAREGQLS